jgi:general secretion pathway protein A
MYEAHFQLRQAPFSIAPDPEFLYLSDGHREAFAHLTYGLSQGGFVLISGEVGTGKTTLLRNLLQQMPQDVEVAFILNPRLTVRELLETICDELRIDYSRSDRTSVKHYIDALNAHLLATHASGRSTVLIIDEAQNLAPAVLEQIRLLTNLETDKRKLLRVMLLGQPELLELLARKELRQLAQRITARYHLRGLDRAETAAYVLHRLKRAGGSALIFTTPALNRLYRLSGGIPRLINLIADRALLGAYGAGQHRVHWRMVGSAAREVLGRRSSAMGRWIAAGVASAALVALFVAWLLWPSAPESSNASQTAASVPAPRAASTGTAPAPSDPTDASDAPGATPGAATTQAANQAPPVPAPQDPAPGATVDTPANGAAPAPTIAQLPAAAGGKSDNASAQAAAPVTAPARVAAGTSATAGARANAAAPATPSAIPARADARAAPLAKVLKRPEMTTFQSQRLAYQAAFARWGADFATASLSTIPCDFAPTAGLQCLGGTGTWNDLRQLDLPAVLELWDEGPTPFYGALVGMSDSSVTLSVGGNELRYATAELGNNWFGGYVLLWKMPPDYSGSLKQGDRHPSVRWVRGQLETLHLASPGTTTDGDAFDADLHAAVMRFQESESMLPDGVVGPQTWIRLAHRLGHSQPRLSG